MEDDRGLSIRVNRLERRILALEQLVDSVEKQMRELKAMLTRVNHDVKHEEQIRRIENR